MTFNEYNLKVEINASINVHTIDTIMDYYPNKYNLYGCHNFYPHAYSGLALDYFDECTDRFKRYGLRTVRFCYESESKYIWTMACYSRIGYP